MRLLNDIQHLTFLTADMDRLLDFYQRVFDAPVVIDMVEEGVRHAFIPVGTHTLLHPFQIPGIAPPPRQEMFQRGRLDHFALNAASEEAFLLLRQRLLREEATDGVVIDMGPLWVLTFSDPDEGQQEVVWAKPDATYDQALPRPEWTEVPLD